MNKSQLLKMRLVLSRAFAVLALFLVFTESWARSADRLIALNTPEGATIFQHGKSTPYFWNLYLQYSPQANLTYCSIASSVTVLNALQFPAPAVPTHGSYRFFTQENFFSDAVQRVLPAELVKEKGATLNQISAALKVIGASVKTFHANETSLDRFRYLALDAMSHQKGYVIVNYGRTALGQEGGGHMSPLAAYDKLSDRFLILDVARYRYPPIWVKAHDLWAAMNSSDQDAKEIRGFLIVEKGKAPRD